MLDAESMAVIVRISVERFYIQSNEMKSNKQTKIVFDADYNFMFDFSPLADNLSLTDILNTFPLSTYWPKSGSDRITEQSNQPLNHSV